MSPLVPKNPKPWRDDPGHIVDAPEPPPMPNEQEDLGPGESIPSQEEPGRSSASPAPAWQPAAPGREAEEAALDGEAENRSPAEVPELASVDVPEELAQQIRDAMARYPQKRSASIPALWAVQRLYGYCSPEGITQAAAVMGVTPGFLQSVASFYDLFRMEPEGEHQVLVCTNISCWLRGGDDLFAAFKEAGAPAADAPSPGTPGGHNGQEVPETDGAASSPTAFVRSFECLGACDIAPMASIDERYYGPLEPADAAVAMSQLRNGEEVLPDKRLADRGAAGGAEAGADDRAASHPLNKSPNGGSSA